MLLKAQDETIILQTKATAKRLELIENLYAACNSECIMLISTHSIWITPSPIQMSDEHFHSFSFLESSA